MVQLSQCNPPGCEVSCQPGTDSTCIVASPMLCSGQPNGRESCITLESGPTHSQASTKFVACNTRKSHAACEECCEQGYGCMGVRKTLLLDVVASETHQNNHSYVCELSRPTLDSLRKNLERWAVTGPENRTHTKLSKLDV